MTIHVGHTGKVYSIDWQENAPNVVTAGQDGNLLIWDAMKQTKKQVVFLESPWVMTASYHPKGTMVASAGLDNTVTVYKTLAAGEEQKMERPSPYLRKLEAHSGYVPCIKFLGDRRLLTCSGDMTAILWDLETQAVITMFQDHQSDVMSISPSGDRNSFVSGGCDSTAKHWDIRSGNVTSSFRGHESDINSVAYHPSGLGFATASDDTTCRLFDLRAGTQSGVYEFESNVSGISSVDFSPSGRILYAGYDDNKIGLGVWDTLLEKSIATTAQTFGSRVSSVAVQPGGGGAIATASWDGIGRILA